MTSCDSNPQSSSLEASALPTEIAEQLHFLTLKVNKKQNTKKTKNKQKKTTNKQKKNKKTMMCVCKDKRVFIIRKELHISGFYFPVQEYSNPAVLPSS